MPSWGAECHRVCPPVWVPTAHHTPGLEGVPPLQLPVPWGLVGEASRSLCDLETARPLGSALRVELLPPSQSQQRLGCCGKWYCTAGSVPCTCLQPRASCHPESRGPQREGLLMGWPGVRVQPLPLPPSLSSGNRRARQGVEGARVHPVFLSVNNLH